MEEETTPETRVCKQCQKELPITQFPVTPQCRGGRRPKCWRCSENPEKYQAKRRRYYEKHRERFIQKAVASQQRNAERRKVYLKQYREQHPEQVVNYQVNAKLKPDYYERVRERAKRQRQRDPGSFLRASINRRARKLGAQGTWTMLEWNELCDHYGGVCLCCGEPKKLHRDHVIPLAKGGSNDITNLQPLCHNCNSRKWAYDHDYRPDKGEWARLTFRSTEPTS